VQFIQLTLSGLALGAAYALIALGFVLVLNTTRAVNFAQGDLVVTGGFIGAALASQLPLPGYALLPVVMLAMAGIGLCVSAIAYWPIRSRPPVAVFTTTIAVGIILQNGLNGVFGPEPRNAPPLFAGSNLDIYGLAVSRQSLAIIGAAALLITGQLFLTNYTQLGRAMRATAQDRDMAAAIGIPVARMVAFTFAASAALGGAAGLLLANQFFVTPTDGTNLIIKAYIAVVIGGWGRIGGALAGAMLIALFETVISAWIDYTVATGLLYAVVLAILLVRPSGLFGEVEGRRA
jgi:branched-chain amino acid transport system permease protein